MSLLESCPLARQLRALVHPLQHRLRLQLQLQHRLQLRLRLLRQIQRRRQPRVRNPARLQRRHHHLSHYRQNRLPPLLFPRLRLMRLPKRPLPIMALLPSSMRPDLR